MNQLISSYTVPTQAKWAFTTRRVNHGDVKGIIENTSLANSGDLIVAEVLEIGSHKRVQLARGRNSDLHIGDLVVLCCGARYAPDQFEGLAEVNFEQADLLAGGGVIGTMRQAHGRMTSPTKLKPLGLLVGENGMVLNINDYKVPESTERPTIPVIAVTGTAMNSGKTTSAFSLTSGLCRAGHKVAAIKVTGTGAFGDFNAFLDAGADLVLDFTDAGMVTTYKQSLERILHGALSLINVAQNSGADVVVVELGDGILQEEAWSLLTCETFKTLLGGIIFAAPDALSAIAGVNFMQEAELELTAVSGLLTRSPLLCEEYSRYKDVPVLSKAQLSNADMARELLNSVSKTKMVA